MGDTGVVGMEGKDKGLVSEIVGARLYFLFRHRDRLSFVNWAQRHHQGSILWLAHRCLPIDRD